MNDQRISVSPFENLPIAIYTCDEKGFLTFYNSAAIRLWGREPEIGAARWCGCLKMYYPNGMMIDLAKSAVARVTNSKKAVSREEVLMEGYTGGIKNAWISVMPTFDHNGNFNGSVTTIVDISEQTADEAKQAILASIIESSEDAIIGKTLKGIITSWNQGAVSLFGYSATEAIGHHISLIIPPSRMEEENMIIEKIRNGEKVDHFETIRITKGGSEIPISLTVSPIKNLHGQIIGASKIARDIARQKQDEMRLQHYANHLEELVADRTRSLNEMINALENAKDEISRALQAEKELGQLKSRFVSMASHEFRTPLSGIRLSASLIDKYAAPLNDAHIVKHVDKIKHSVDGLTAILNDFLSLEKLETGKVELTPDDFDLVKFCIEISEEMQLTAKQRQKIQYEHSGFNKIVCLDQNLLRNCVINLISNAIKYSGEESLIVLKTELDTDNCCVSVKDNGIGIPEEDQQRLFEAFFRAHNTGNIQGTGLGLNIVARYTKLMNGRIEFASAINEGTEFILVFPLK